MGTIRIYDAQVGGTPAINSRADAEDFGAAIGRGLRAVGAGMQRKGREMEQEQEQHELSDAASRGYQDDLELEKAYAKYAESAVPGDREAATRWEQQVRDYFTNNPDRPAYNTPRAQKYQRELQDRTINQFGVRGLGLQAALNGQKFKDDVILAGDAMNQQAMANPDSYVSNRDRIRTEAESGVGIFAYSTPGQRTAVTESLVEGAAFAAGHGYLAKPGGVESFLGEVAPGALQGKDWKGSLKTKDTAYQWFNDLDYDKQIQLITRADADYQQSRRLAAGNLKDLIDNQLAELKLYGTVKHPLSQAQFAILGEDAEKEWRAYQGNRKAYGLAFEYIKLDPAEAVRLMESLKPAPGDVNPDNLRQYELVRGAYGALRQQLEQDQVGTAQAREMPGIRKEVNWADDNAVLSELSLRGPAARDLSLKTGKMKWLSNPEAETLRQRLAGMGDNEVRRFFHGARMAIKDPAEARAFAAQLYPDNPAALNAATLDFKTGMGVAVDGQMYDASTVSTRLRAGARFLDKKTDEGKGLRDSGMPPDDKLLKSFRAEVGDAVPVEYMDAAFQTAKAMYIGEGLATRSGISSGMVDTKLLRRAVDLSLGMRHTNPDGSRVFLPWGMDATRFRNEAKARYDVLRQKHGLTGGFDSQSFAPIPDREGVYGIKLGNGISYAIDLNAPVEQQQ